MQGKGIPSVVVEDSAEEWTVDRILLRLLLEISRKLGWQEGHAFLLRECIALTRAEAYHIEWDEDGRLHCCRFVEPPPSHSRFLFNWHPLKDRSPVVLDLRQFPDLDSISVPLQCDYHCSGGFMCGRGGVIELNSDGRCIEAPTWMS